MTNDATPNALCRFGHYGAQKTSQEIEGNPMSALVANLLGDRAWLSGITRSDAKRPVKSATAFFRGAPDGLFCLRSCRAG